MRFEKKNTEVIDDPVRHAESVYQKRFHVVQKAVPWESVSGVCVTSQFASLGKGYQRHCGPVAITNLILTLDKWSLCGKNRENTERMKGRYTDSGQNWQDCGQSLLPEDVFLRVSRIGEKTLIYHNMDLLHHFGGTSDALTGLYIRVCLRRCHLACSVLPCVPYRKGLFMEWAKEGRILYLQLRNHPCYGDHHVICYGAVEVESEDREEHELYLAIADGWAPHLRYLAVSGLGICFVHQIIPEKNR